MKFTSYKLQALFVGMTLVFSGCEHLEGSLDEQVSLQERMLPHLNPTNYEFDATISEIKSAIKNACGKWRRDLSERYGKKVWGGGGDIFAKRLLSQTLQLSGEEHLLWKGDGDSLARNLLTKPGNENDAYLYGDISPIGESLIYFKDGHPLIYYADFHIHLTMVSPKKTRLEISTYVSRVATGVDESWSPHGPSLIEVHVDPTTIEAYEILLRIGKQLGTNGMPLLVIPASDSSVRELTLREHDESQ